MIRPYMDVYDRGDNVAVAADIVPRSACRSQKILLANHFAQQEEVDKLPDSQKAEREKPQESRSGAAKIKAVKPTDADEPPHQKAKATQPDFMKQPLLSSAYPPVRPDFERNIIMVL